MLPFAYTRVVDIGQALKAGVDTGQGQVDAPTQYLAGGTTLIDLMKIEVLRPTRVVDIGALADRHARIEARPDGLHLGAFVTMAQAADDPTVQREYPAIAQSLSLAASAQLRNMASLAGKRAAANALRLLPRPQVDRLQQAQPRFRLFGHRWCHAQPRRPGCQRPMHRAISR